MNSNGLLSLVKCFKYATQNSQLYSRLLGGRLTKVQTTSTDNTSSRSICTTTPNNYKFKKLQVYKDRLQSEKDVIDRFQRLNNGLWVHRQPSAFKKAWIKRMYGGEKRFSKLREHLIVNEERSKMLDSMVSEKWKKTRWTVSDPYKGIDEHCMMHTNPYHTPDIEKAREEDRDFYLAYRFHEYRKKYKRIRIRDEKKYTYKKCSHMRDPPKKRSKLSKEGMYGTEPKAIVGPKIF